MALAFAFSGSVHHFSTIGFDMQKTPMTTEDTKMINAVVLDR